MNRNEMAEVYDRLKNTVYRVALTYCRNTQDAEDITQEVFLALFAAEREFPPLEAEKAWAIRVTMNKSKNLLKSFHKSRSASLEAAADISEKMPDKSVHEAINSLPDKYRMVVYLYYIEGYSVKEISKMTSDSVSAVQVQLFRARKKLKKMLGEEIE